MSKEVVPREVLKDAPVISFGALGRPFGVGPGKTKAEAERLGLEVAVLPNGRAMLTIAQAQLIASKMCGGSGR